MSTGVELTPKSDIERLLEASILKVAEERNGHLAVVPMVKPEPVPPEIVTKLKAPLPAEAITQHPTKTYLSSIKPAYIIERLNEVFGPGAWQERYEFVESQHFTKTVNRKVDGKFQSVEIPATMVVMKAYFSVPRYGIAIEAYGGNDNDDRGDAYKGACTDALTKVASHLGIGLDVYKGRENQRAPEQPGRQRRNQSDPESTDGPAVSPEQAQKAVIDRKLAESEAFRKAEAELKAKAEAKAKFVKPWHNRKEFIGCMEGVREQVGEVAYLGVLNGYHNGNRVPITTAAQFVSTDDAVKAYRELLALVRKGA